MALAAFDEGGDDPRIGSAAANIAVHELDDFFRRGIGILAQERDARHDHAAGAITALHGADVEESLLERMQLAILSRPSMVVISAAATVFRAVTQERTGAPSTRHGAGAAPAFAAAVFRAGQAKIVAQQIEQGRSSSASTSTLAPLIRSS